MITILIKLIAAHLVGDFLLQSDKLCRLKYESRSSCKIPALAIHSVIQAALTYIFVGQWCNWILPVCIGISHFVIDLVKVQSGRKDLISLVMDQIAHYVILYLLWWVMFVRAGYPFNPADMAFSPTFWVLATSYVAVLAPTSILIKAFMDYEKWMPGDASVQGLPNAGRWIGYLERILILTFIFTGNVEGIGFLLAAKSVFRFGELNRAKDIKVTEYVLIGTFASFAIAILIGFSAQWLISFGKEILY